MTIQARLSANDPRLYNVNRDVAHNFKDVIKLVGDRLEDGTWGDLNDLLGDHDVSLDELGEAHGAFCRFLVMSGTNPKAGMEDALREAGWFDLRPEAQIGVMATLGSVTLGIHFAGIREATLGGNGPAMEIQELLEFGEQSSKLIAEGRWRRAVRRFKSRVQFLFRTLFRR